MLLVRSDTQDKLKVCVPHSTTSLLAVNDEWSYDYRTLLHQISYAVH